MISDLEIVGGVECMGRGSQLDATVEVSVGLYVNISPWEVDGFGVWLWWC